MIGLSRITLSIRSMKNVQRQKKKETQQLPVVYKPFKKLRLKRRDLGENKNPLFQHDPGHYKSAQAKWDIRLLSHMNFASTSLRNLTERSRLIPLILNKRMQAWLSTSDCVTCVIATATSWLLTLYTVCFTTFQCRLIRWLFFRLINGLFGL